MCNRAPLLLPWLIKCSKLTALILVIHFCISIIISRTELDTEKYSYGTSRETLKDLKQSQWRQHHHQPPSVESPLVVVLLSSTQRSGSSMLGELLATMGNSFYWFEPFRTINHTDCYNNKQCSSEYLSLIYKCTLESKLNYKKCRNTSSRVMKLVRGSLANISVVLTHEDVNVKMIHLTRDPRGSLSSIPSSWGSGGNKPALRCKEINQDMDAFDPIQREFPGRIMNVSYERFCNDSLGKTKEIFHFLYGNSTLPNKTLTYLQSHMSGVPNGYYSTVRNTSSHIDEWRKEIKMKLFNEIEKEPYCQAIIKKMGYRFFGSVDAVRNMSVSVFL